MALVPHIKPGDWKAVQDAISKLATIRLGSESTPTFGAISIQGNTTVSTLDAVSAVISAGSFTSLYTQSFVCLSATVSAGTFTSIDFTQMAGISATISSLAVTSINVASGAIPIVTAFPSPTFEGETVYLNSSTDNNLYVYKEIP